MQELKLKELVVGYDFSKGAQAALNAGIYFARRIGANLHLVTAIPGAVDPRTLQAIKDRGDADLGKRDRTADVLTEVEKMVREDISGFDLGGLELTLDVELQSPVDSLLRYSEGAGGDMLLVGSMGRQVYYDAREVGVDAQRIARRSPVPVLIVRDADTFPPARIVCAIDFSEASERAFGWALDLAKMTQASVTALHVMERGSPAFSEVWGVDTPAFLDNERFVSQERMEEFVAGFEPDVEVMTMIRRGRPADAILDLLKEGRHQLLTIGSLGRNALWENLVGGTAERVIRHAPCSVLAVKPDKHHVRSGYRGGTGTTIGRTGLAR